MTSQGELSLAAYNAHISNFFLIEKIEAKTYCVGTRAWDWDGGKAFDGTAGTYERTLDEFLMFNPAGSPLGKLGLLVLVGGIGTGKSTAILEAWQRLLKQTRKCSYAAHTSAGCNIAPLLIHLDLREVYEARAQMSPRVERRQTKVSVQSRLFWNSVGSRIETLIPMKFTFADECSFWHWCLSNEQVRDRSEAIHRWLAVNEYQIRAVIDAVPYAGWTINQIAQHLERARKELLEVLGPEDSAWYKVFRFLYARSLQPGNGCPCAYILLDNVDQLEPELQRIAVNFVTLLTPVIKARTIIAIRPLTWERSFDAHELIRADDHFSPNFRDVLLGRLRMFQYEAGCPAAVADALRRLIDELTGDNTSLWSEMFEATAGLSVRFALRNFVNLTQSPLLEHGSLSGLNATNVARAFFFGNSDSIITHAFDNLYKIGRDSRREYRLVKSRILHYILQTQSASTTKAQLLALMTDFGYDDSVVLKALNNLLVRLRPLVWCDDGHDAFQFADSARIAITPIGDGYFKTLFGQLYYDETCLATTLRAKSLLEDTLAFHAELWEQDAVEIKHFVKKRGNLMIYLQLYPLDAPSISFLHAQSLRVGFEKRKSKLPAGFDEQRVDFIRAGVLKILGLDDERP